MDIRLTTATTIAKFIANDLESYLVVEFPTYEYANDMGTATYRNAADGNRFDVWLVGDSGTPIGSIHEGNNALTPKRPARVIVRNMDLFTAD
jgi:hypothetical protein